MPQPPRKRLKPSKPTTPQKQPEEITFDTTQRHDFLTGFHKRKVARAKHAQETAARKARDERIAARKKIRDERKADLERHVRELDALMGTGRVDSGEEDGDKDTGNVDGDVDGDVEEARPLSPVDHEAEYVDEDKYTTVTVEEVDVSREGFMKIGQDTDESLEEEDSGTKVIAGDHGGKVKKPKTAAERKRDQESKLKKRKRKNFRYESKGERKVARVKERSKNSKQARARKKAG